MFGYNNTSNIEPPMAHLTPEEINERVRILKVQIDQLRLDVAGAVAKSDFEDACRCRDQADGLRSLINALIGDKP